MGDRKAILELWSGGHIDQREAVRRGGFRDGAELLVVAGRLGLPMPMPPEEETERQAEVFASLLERNRKRAAGC